MTTYREAIYMCLDLLKGMSDDFTYTEEHIAYLLDKYRAFLLKQKYENNPKKHVPYSNYQTLTVYLNKYDSNLYKSDEPLPFMLQLGIPRITTEEYYNYTFDVISRERLPFVGNNKFIKNTCYCAIDNEGYLCLKFPNDNNESMVELKLTAIFENAREISDIKSYENGIDVLDSNLALEEDLIPNLIELVVKVLSVSIYRPEDAINNGRDDLANLYNFINRNMKSNLTKQLE